MSMNKHQQAKRHAYLIMAHTNPEQLCVLLKQIDDPRNDIFIHYDGRFVPPVDDFRHSVIHSELIVLPDPIKVYWGDYSQIQCELRLLEIATERDEYEYYHLISGQDLLLKTQDYVHDFFERNGGKEFISIDGVEAAKKNDYRYKYYYPHLKRIKNLKSKRKKALLFAWMMGQKMVGIDRTRRIDVEFQKGANWFSITDRCARYVISQKAWIRDIFRDTYCCDELFLQTVVFNSEMPFDLYQNPNGEGNMRLIDWKRGNPYTFRKTDIQELKASPALFARKFDQKIDSKIISILGE